MATTNIAQYATASELEAYLGNAYPMPAEPDRVLQRASEIVAEATFGRVQTAWHVIDVDNPADQWTDAIRDAVCAQVEFWMETGEEFDVVGLGGSLGVGRLQVHRLPSRLSVRARRHLSIVGLFSGMVDYAP